MVNNNKIIHALGSNEVLFSGENQTYTITYNAVPKKYCTQIISSTSNFFNNIKVNNNLVKEGDIENLNIENVIKECDNDFNKIDFSNTLYHKLAVCNNCEIKNKGSKQEPKKPVTPPPINNCLINPTLEGCNPPDKDCTINPTLPECSTPTDPCIKDPTLPECSTPTDPFVNMTLTKNTVFPSRKRSIIIRNGPAHQTIKLAYTGIINGESNKQFEVQLDGSGNGVVHINFAYNDSTPKSTYGYIYSIDKPELKTLIILASDICKICD